MKNNIRKFKAIEEVNRERLLKVNPQLPNSSGIYILTRVDENGIKYAYIGQAINILARLTSHLNGYQHIDLSLKKHKFYSPTNPYGWKIGFLRFPIALLDEKEKYYIKKYADSGYQLRNKTAGGQGEGKTQIAEYRPARGYRDGLKQGYANASKEISILFDKYLDFTCKGEKTKLKERAMSEFQDFLDFYKMQKEDKGKKGKQE